MVRPSTRSSSEDRRVTSSSRRQTSRSKTPTGRTTQTSVTKSFSSSSSTGGGSNAPLIGNVRITRTEDRGYQPQETSSRSYSSGLTSSLSLTSPSSITRRSLTDLSSSRNYSRPRSTTPTERGRARERPAGVSNPQHDLYVIGYATVTTQDRPAGGQGINYKAFVSPVARPSAKTASQYTTKSSSTSSRRYYSDDEDYVKPVPAHHYSTSSLTSYRPSAPRAPEVSYRPLPPVTSSASTSSTSSYTSRRRRPPPRSSSLPRLDLSVYDTQKYSTPTALPSSSSSTRTWRPLSNGPEYRLETTTRTSRTRTPTALPTIHQDLNDAYYRRLRDIHLQRSSSPILHPVDDYKVYRSSYTTPSTLLSSLSDISTSSYQPPTRAVSSYLLESTTPVTSVTTLRSGVSDYMPSSVAPLTDFQPTDVHTVLLPNGQRAVSYTKQSQTGYGDHQVANAEIERIAKKTKYLQDSMHSLEDFIKRNRSLFPVDMILYQYSKFYRLTEDELRRMGEPLDAEVYGVKIKEKLVVPYGTEVIEILRRHYSKHRDVEVEFDDVDKIRLRAAMAEKSYLPTKDTMIRKIVESEIEDNRDRLRSLVPPRP